MQKNPQAQATASRRAIAKSKKIKDLGISPDLTVQQQDTIVLRLSEAKGLEANKPLSEFVKGQEWYIKDLMSFSALTAQERFDYEYAHAFHEVASEDEVIEGIAAFM